MKPDYPAAHSMDTSWYAVDREGHVAKFETGEAGGVPGNATEETDLVDQLIAAGSVEFDVEGLTDAADGALYQIDWDAPWPGSVKNKIDAVAWEEGSMNALLWLRNEAAFHELSKTLNPNSFSSKLLNFFPGPQEPLRGVTENPKQLNVPDKLFVWVPGIQKKTLTNLIDRGLLLRGWLTFYDLPLERFGVYCYSHGNEFENWIAGPYVREGEPRRPIRLEDLPDELRKHVEAVRFTGLRFDNEPLVQPFEHLDSHCWGSAWIATNGERHGEAEDDE